MKKIILSMLICFSFCINVSAASKCSYEEQAVINNEASLIKAVYTVNTKDVNTSFDPADVKNFQKPYTEYFNVSIMNLSSKFYVKVFNENKLLGTYYGNDTETVSFDYNDINSITNLTFSIYTSNNTGCPNENIIDNYLVLPMRNRFAELDVCRSDKFKDSYVCQKFVTTEVTTESFNKVVDDYHTEVTKMIEKKNNKDSNGIIKYIKEHKVLVISLSVICVIGVTSIVVIHKKNRRLV